MLLQYGSVKEGVDVLITVKYPGEVSADIPEVSTNNKGKMTSYDH